MKYFVSYKKYSFVAFKTTEEVLVIVFELVDVRLEKNCVGDTMVKLFFH